MKKYICIVLIILCLPVIAFSEQVIHYDLSEMNQMMAFSMLFQININPDFFLGTTIKIRGRFFRDYSDYAERYYNYVMITDEMGCCQDGLEFQINGKENLAENYPTQNEFIEVIGVLKTMEIKGNIFSYLSVDSVSY